MENIFTIYGAALKQARKGVKGMTQAKLAAAIGIDRTTYNQWEAKTSIEIDRNLMELLVKELNITLDVLTNVARGTLEEGQDILDHPVIKSLVDQSKYILKRVEDLEKENDNLKRRLGGPGAQPA